jgi:hypothetical protein
MGNGYQVFCPGLGGREGERERREEKPYLQIGANGSDGAPICGYAHGGRRHPDSPSVPNANGGLAVVSTWRQAAAGRHRSAACCLPMALHTRGGRRMKGWWRRARAPPGTRGWGRVGIEWERHGLGGQGWLLTGGERQGLGGQGEGVADRWARRIKTIIY